MTTHTLALRVACLTAVGGGVFALSSAFAQKVEEITVIAPWSVTKEVESRTSTGGKVELISLMRHVYYGDLNLANHADVMTLEKRISDIAKESCEQLAKMYPLSSPNSPNCVEKAAASAKAQMDKVVATAGKAQR